MAKTLTRVIYPTLDVFYYSLQSSLGDDDAKKHQRREVFIQGCHFDDRLAQIFREQSQYHDVDLLGNEQISPFSKETSYKGYYYPKRLNDCYALLLDCSIEDSETHIYTTNNLLWLERLQEILQKRLNRFNKTLGYLGETWMLSFALPEVSDKASQQQIAESCYRQLLPRVQDLSIECADFLGGSLFRFCYFDNKQQQEFSLFIGIYPDKDTIINLGKVYYQHLMHLFHYQHKVLWAYQQNLQLRQQLIAAIPEVRHCQQQVDVLTNQHWNLDAIETSLSAARAKQVSYAKDLRLLLDQRNTININAYNYQQRIKKIQQLSGNQLTLFTQLAEVMEKHYLLQVQRNYDNLSPEMDLMDKLVAYIAVNLNLRKEQQDRRFIKRIEIFGMTFALAAIVSSTSGDFPIKNEMDALCHPIGHILSEYFFIPDRWLDSGISIVLSVIVVAIPLLIWYKLIPSVKTWIKRWTKKS